MHACMHAFIHTTGYKYTMDDVIFLPTLRTATVVKNLTWPDRVKNYVNGKLSEAKIESYSNYSI